LQEEKAALPQSTINKSKKPRWLWWAGKIEWFNPSGDKRAVDRRNAGWYPVLSWSCRRATGEEAVRRLNRGIICYIRNAELDTAGKWHYRILLLSRPAYCSGKLNKIETAVNPLFCRTVTHGFLAQIEWLVSIP